MLKVIDISSHQSVETAGIDGIDAVIVKATQGTGYIIRNAMPSTNSLKRKVDCWVFTTMLAVEIL